MGQPVFRFAPSPNGRLHLGHAYSALLNADMARAQGGRFLVRIEDIDTERCTPEHIANALDDLRWLELPFEEPVLQQSQRMAAYRNAIAQLMEMGLLYVCTCTRRHLSERASAQATAPRDPEGQMIYPGTCRRIAHMFTAESALRLDMDKALRRARNVADPLAWIEKGEHRHADPAVWGDVVIARKGIGTSYHLSVVVDDAFQKVTDVVRGEDLFEATSIHRLLQVLLRLPEPRYHHHALIRHDSGRKLAKSHGDESLADLRAAGVSPAMIRGQLGFT
jgi:glutamyl-Q tRNA(Asp) synthetase